MAAHPTQGIPPEAKLLPNYPWHGCSIEKQLNYIYGNLEKKLEPLGSSLRHIMKINSYHTNPAEVDMAVRLRKKWFGAEAPPPSSLLLVPEVPVHGATVNLDMTNLAADAPLGRQLVPITRVPPIAQVAATGWAIYSQAVRGGGFVFTRGTTPTGERGPIDEIVPHPELAYRHNPIRFQTEYILDYLKKILADAGCSLEDVVRAEIYLQDMRDLAVFDEVWGEFFPTDPPARTVIPSALVTPFAVVEIEFIAIDPQGSYRKETVATTEAPTPLGVEPQAVKAGPYLFLSTHMATDYRQGVPPEACPDPNFPFHSSSIRRQVEYIYKNVESICRAAGTTPQNLVKRRAIHLNLSELPEAEHVWQEKLGDRLPPTTAFRTDGPLAVPGCTVQYDLTAAILD
jgi:enamine deaminase RidA (YjgF/YER057c/UK114 family)